MRDLFHEEKSEIKVKAVALKQPIGKFFIGVISSRDLIEITYSDVRRIEGERGFETYLGIQRPLKKDRVKEIAGYVNTSDACFPTAVILSVREQCAYFDEGSGELILSAYKAQSEDDVDIQYHQIAKVIDGQHRIEGLVGYKGEDFDVNVSVFVEIDVASEAYLFSTVNLAQTKVNKSLVYDLFELAEKQSPQKLCHNIAVTLDKMPESPLYRKIKRLGTAESHNLPSSITQAAFVQSLIGYLSGEPLLDRDRYMRGRVVPRAVGTDAQKRIFRDFMVDGRDLDLTDLIWNYFAAVRNRWPDAWGSQDKGIMLGRTNGFMALMRFLRICYLQIGRINEVPAMEEFLAIFQRVELKDADFTVDNFKPGTSGESALFRTLKEQSAVG